MSAVFTRQQALAAASSAVSAETASTPDVALRLVSFDPAGGATMPTGVTDDLKVSNVLAWVIVYPDSPAVVRGPASLSPAQTQSIAASLTCQWIVVFNANTGAGIDNEQLCRGANPG
ncbi:MAG: hypothetical protein ABI232_09140 [Jatrophihabitantaceae bacterium]